MSHAAPLNGRLNAAAAYCQSSAGRMVALKYALISRIWFPAGNFARATGSPSSGAYAFGVYGIPCACINSRYTGIAFFAPFPVGTMI